MDKFAPLSRASCTSASEDPIIPADMDRLLGRCGLAPLRLAGRNVLPIVQGGMGIGVSAHRLAGTVAAHGAVGTLSAVDLRRHHPDLMEQTRGLGVGSAAKEAINAVNLIALEREIDKAQSLAAGRGLLAMNVMRAVSDYAAYIERSLACGIDAVVVGAGLPLDLPDLAAGHPRTALIPILSDARGVQLVVRKWERKKRMPDAVVLEHPRLAGGHLGAAKVEDLADPRFEFERSVPETRDVLRAAGIESTTAIIVAGGIRTLEDIRRVVALGASAVQLGTPFAVTTECDAALEFKRVLAQAREEDKVEFTSVAGLPARAVLTPWLKAYLRAEARLQAVAHVKPRCTKVFDCLAQCGLRDGKVGWGQFCVDQQLAAALKGDVKRGLFFTGRGQLPFGEQIRTVKELLTTLLGEVSLVGAAA
jgi:nitronate monooxygenase